MRLIIRKRRKAPLLLAVFIFVQLYKSRFGRYDYFLLATVTDGLGGTSTARLRADDVYTEFALRNAAFDDRNSGNAEMLMSHCANLTLSRISQDLSESS